MSMRTDAIVEWLRQRLNRAGARGFVVGLSGGVDSAVVARLCQAAAPDNVVGVLMPCHSDPRDEADARLVAGEFALPALRVDLSPAFDRLIPAIDHAVQTLPAAQRPAGMPARGSPPSDLAFANVKPRLRMTTLYYIANTLNYLVAGTGNRSELSVGYFTKHGDGGVDLLPIGDLFKSEVRAAAKRLGVPDAIIDKPPSAGLSLGQTDEADMGFSYAELESYLTSGAEAVSPALAMRIERLIRSSAHKRALAPAPGADE